MVYNLKLLASLQNVKNTSRRVLFLITLQVFNCNCSAKNKTPLELLLIFCIWLNSDKLWNTSNALFCKGNSSQSWFNLVILPFMYQCLLYLLCFVLFFLHLIRKQCILCTSKCIIYVIIFFSQHVGLYIHRKTTFSVYHEKQ